MKAGEFFRIPERPSDLEVLWDEGAPLERVRHPGWVEAADACRYRVAGSAKVGGLTPGEVARLEAEIHQLHIAGLVVERDGDTDHAYLQIPDNDVWSIGIYTGASPFELAPCVEARNPVLTRDDVTDVAAAFVADPFMLEVGGLWHMFFEVLNWRSGKGEIGLATSPDGLTWTYRQIVLSEDFHLSYPYVIEWGSEIYMIPESHQAGEVRLYRADPFPTRWVCEGPLVRGPYLVDASPFRHCDRWWLFCEASPERRHDTLRLYGADELGGPWHEHPASPVVVGDARRARPAGRILEMDGRLVRPAQACVPVYGNDVRAFEITELTATTYAERPIHPSPMLTGSGSGWNAAGMHHVDAHRKPDGRWIACVDGWRRARTVGSDPPSLGAHRQIDRVVEGASR